MAKISIKNKTDYDVSFLKPYAEKLQPYLGLVPAGKYPFQVVVLKKKDFYDRSSFDIDSGRLVLKIDMSKQSKEDVAWVLIHEFAHFICTNNPELKKTCLDAEQDTLEEILQKTFQIDSNKVHEIFHDFLPVEVAANFFATLIIGRFHKRHPFKNVTSLIKGKRNGHKKNQ